MKKILIALIGVVAFGYLASPLVIGLIAKEKFPSIVKAADAGNRHWEPGKFNLGYRHSSAESTVTMALAHHQTLVMHLHHQITQRLGTDMSVMEVTTTPTFEGDIKEKVTALFGAKPPFVTHTKIYMDGHYTATMDVPAIADAAIPGQPDLRLSFSGMHGTETGTFTPQAAQSRFSSAGVELNNEKDGVKIKASGLKFSGDLQLIDKWIQVGNVLASADKITLTSKSRSPTQLHNLTIKVAIHHKAGDIDAGYDIHLAKVTSPGFTYSNLALELSARHLDEQTLREMGKRLNAINQRALEPKQAVAMYGAAFQDIGSDLLAHSPQFQIKRLAFDLPSGHLQLTANAQFDGNGFTGPVTPASVSRVTAEANINASKGAYQNLLRVFLRPKAMAYLKARQPDISPAKLLSASQQMTEQMTAQTTQNLLKRHLMQQSDDGYTSHIAYRQGALSINGQTLGAAPMP